MSFRKYRVAIIGCGNIALTGHLPAVLRHPRFELRGLCDVRPERVQAMLDRCVQLSGDTPCADMILCQDYRSLLSSGVVDACILALHPEHSVPVAIAILQNGIAVLDEKPLAASMQDGAQLVQAVEQTGGVYQIGFCLRFGKIFRDVAEWVALIGNPCLYQVSIFDESLQQCQGAYGAMIQSILRRSSVVTHEGSHVIDWMKLWQRAPIHRVKASAVKMRDEFLGPNLWACNLDYADGSTLQLNIGWLLENQPASTLRVVGPAGLLELDLFKGTGQLNISTRAQAVHTEPLCQSWEAQLDTFAEAMDRGSANVATAYDGLDALNATLACERSFREERAIRLEDAQASSPLTKDDKDNARI